MAVDLAFMTEEELLSLCAGVPPSDTSRLIRLIYDLKRHYNPKAVARGVRKET